MTFLLFILGSAVGSFINVVALRYDPDGPMLGRQMLGRSRCPRCEKKLRWFELIPILSFIIQRARCRSCRAGISWQYPTVEILSGLIFVFVPLAIKENYQLLTGFISQVGQISPISVINHINFIIITFLWVLIFATLLLISVIDLRLKLIPDEANILLALFGLGVTYFSSGLKIFEKSFTGPYSLLFGFTESAWANHLFAAFVGGAIFGFIILVTRGRGMGMGDLKLAIPLGLIFGWPDIALLVALAFIVGSLVGGFLMALSALRRARGRSGISEGISPGSPRRLAARDNAISSPATNDIGLKSAVPFGPFLVVAAALVFFCGREIVHFYFKLFPGWTP